MARNLDLVEFAGWSPRVLKLVLKLVIMANEMKSLDPFRFLHVWRTNERSLFERIADITPGNGAFTITLEPASFYSLTSFTGQRKGAAVSPPDAPLPFP